MLVNHTWAATANIVDTGLNPQLAQKTRIVAYRLGGDGHRFSADQELLRCTRRV
jgi:hypothetical protein